MRGGAGRGRTLVRCAMLGESPQGAPACVCPRRLRRARWLCLRHVWRLRCGCAPPACICGVQTTWTWALHAASCSASACWPSPTPVSTFPRAATWRRPVGAAACSCGPRPHAVVARYCAETATTGVHPAALPRRAASGHAHVQPQLRLHVMMCTFRLQPPAIIRQSSCTALRIVCLRASGDSDIIKTVE